MNRPAGERIHAVAATALYLALGVAMLWNALSVPSSLVGGWRQPDTPGTVWMYWWTAHALGNGSSPFTSELAFFPFGMHPVAQYNLLDAILASPVVGLFGVTAGYNVFALAGIVGTALASRFLARVAGASPGAATLAGLAVGACVPLVNELVQGRPTQAFYVPVILGLAATWRLARGDGGRGSAVGLGASVAASAYLYWYYGLFLVMGVAVLVAVSARSLDRRRLLLLGAGVAGGCLLCAPAVLDLAGAWEALPGVARIGAPASDGAGTVDEFTVAQSLMPQWPLVNARPTLETRLGHFFVLGALVPLLSSARGKWPWVALAVVGWVFTLGPSLRIPGHDEGVFPMPFAAMQAYVPFFERLWWPDRFAILVVPPLAVLFALHVDELRSEARRYGWLALPLALVLLGADRLYLNIPGRVPASEMPTTPGAFTQLDGPVVQLPIKPVGHRFSFHLRQQLAHGQPTLYGLGGHIPNHAPPELTAFIEGNSFLSALRTVESDLESSEVTVDRAAVQALVDAGFVWVTWDPVHYAQADAAAGNRVRAVVEGVLGDAELDFEGMLAWRIVTPPADARVADLPRVPPPPPSPSPGG